MTPAAAQSSGPPGVQTIAQWPPRHAPPEHSEEDEQRLVHDPLGPHVMGSGHGQAQ